MILTADAALAEEARSLRSHAMTSMTWERHRGYAESYDVVDIGFNFRLDEPRAALGLSRLARLDGDVDRRRELVRGYRERLSDVPGVTIPWTDEDVERSSHFGFAILLDSGEIRDQVAHELAERGIQTTHYPALNTLSAFRGHGPRPRTEALAARHLLLPLSSTYSGARGRARGRRADDAAGGRRHRLALTAPMRVAGVAEEPTRRAAGARVRPIAGYAWLIPGLVVVALMLVWAVHDGGYDADTWYWGALLVLGLLAAVVIARGWRAIQLSRPAKVALVAFALYVAWSYLSISWAASPGDALTGSNRALLYLLVFATMLVLPWTARGALIALVTFALGIGVIAIVLLVRLASADHVAALVIEGRLAAPTGYFNATAALFTIGALTAIALAARRELPGLLRGALIGFACAGLQLAVIVQSRGWLFTLPLVLIAAIVVLPDRLRVAAAAVRARGGDARRGAPPACTSTRPIAGRRAQPCRYPSRACGTARLLGRLRGGHAARLGRVAHPGARGRAPLRRRVLGTIAVLLAAGAAIAGGLAVSARPPVQVHLPPVARLQPPGRRALRPSHFTDVGSGRYDFWRVALDAFVAHPVGGLGQDNFDNYYVPRRRTDEEPAWTHSLELRLLAHTGLVGAVLFAAFLVAGIAAALRGAAAWSARGSRRRRRPAAARRVVDLWLGRLVLGDSRPERPGARVPGRGGGPGARSPAADAAPEAEAHRRAR